MSITGRPPADDDDFAARLAHIDATPDAVEALRWRTAEAMYLHDLGNGALIGDIHLGVTAYLPLADIAITTITTPLPVEGAP